MKTTPLPVGAFPFPWRAAWIPWRIFSDIPSKNWVQGVGQEGEGQEGEGREGEGQEGEG